jgi:hypothetical protein
LLKTPGTSLAGLKRRIEQTGPTHLPGNGKESGTGKMESEAQANCSETLTHDYEKRSVARGRSFLRSANLVGIESL